MITVETFTSVANTYFSEPYASLLNGMLFGVDLYSKSELYSQLKAVGLLHLVVLSGMNITLLATFISIATQSLGKYISLLLTTFMIVIFIVFVGAQAPIIRAGIMGILTFVSVILGRRTIALYTLVISAVLTAMIWPQWIQTVSFQLSYGATLGIILFGKHNVRDSFIKKEFKTSLAAQVFTVPIIFYYFRQVSFISPLANVLVSILVAPIMILGFITVFLGKISYVLGLVPAFFTLTLLSYMVWVAEILSRLPFSFVSF